ncbi:MAG: tetratricopeptide repeat protein [Desulfobacteraceae bacterium]|nr:tetratricopeptide repeat protein [Desulfobacteraceae bacterium]
MDMFTQVTAETFFDSFSNQSSQMTAVANQALSSGIQKYMDKDYKGAAAEFKRSFGLDPYSDYAVDAVKYQVMAYQKLGQPDQAINAYKQLLQVQPDRDDAQTALGNLYFSQGRTGDAIKAYEAAVRIYDDTTNRFSLGQGYLKAGRYDDAVNQFQKVIKMDQSSPNGYFGLGQALTAKKKYTEAIGQFERAIQKKKDFYDAYAEMGFTYADAGDVDKANEMKDLLEHKNQSLALVLGAYIDRKTPPKILSITADSTFAYFMPAKTEVSALSSYLANAGTNQTFTMQFQFNKSMDRESIENPTNWTIKRSTTNGPGTDYNNGMALPATEARISPTPSDIYWDAENLTATVRFTISQNASADATIDPSHIEFTFKGTDSDGNTMHPKYDQYMGFSGSF